MSTTREQMCRPHRIMVMDCDRGYLTFIALILRKAGHEVLTAAHFTAALDVLDANPPDMLITSVVNPGGLNGIALSRMARLRRRDIRIIFLLNGEVPDIEQAAAGMSILHKPLSPDDLVSAVEHELRALQPH